MSRAKDRKKDVVGWNREIYRCSIFIFLSEGIAVKQCKGTLELGQCYIQTVLSFVIETLLGTYMLGHRLQK